MDSKTVIATLLRDGWIEQIRKAISHRQFKHPTKPGRVTVSHPSKDLPIKTIKSIEQRSGLRFR